MSNEKLETVVVANKLEKSQGRSPGSRLRKAREAKGYSLEEIARKLFLSTQVVQQLENDEYQVHHSITFLRGYLRSYARLVDMDTEMLIAEFNAMGLTDAPPAMSTQRIYHRDSSIISKSLPWVGTVIGVVVLLFVVSWIHAEFSNNQITNPIASAENAVAATVTQTNNAVSVALTPTVTSNNASSNSSNSVNNSTAAGITTTTTGATVAANSNADTTGTTTSTNSSAMNNSSSSVVASSASNSETNSNTTTNQTKLTKNAVTKSEKTSSMAIKSKATLNEPAQVAVAAKPKPVMPF